MSERLGMREAGHGSPSRLLRHSRPFEGSLGWKKREGKIRLAQLVHLNCTGVLEAVGSGRDSDSPTRSQLTVTLRISATATNGRRHPLALFGLSRLTLRLTDRDRRSQAAARGAMESRVCPVRTCPPTSNSRSHHRVQSGSGPSPSTARRNVRWTQSCRSLYRVFKIFQWFRLMFGIRRNWLLTE